MHCEVGRRNVDEDEAQPFQALLLCLNFRLIGNEPYSAFVGALRIAVLNYHLCDPSAATRR